jgi:hypothetical protein
MKPAILAVLLFASSAQAQTRVLVGPEAGQQYSSTYIGIQGGVEQPIGKRLELDATARLYLYERKTDQGTGTMNNENVMALARLTNFVSLAGGAEYKHYAVTKLTKSSYYTLAGIAIDHDWLGSPNRVELLYVREFQNYEIRGIDPNRLQAARVSVDTVIDCSKRACYRLRWEVDAGRVLTQGRAAKMSGGASVAFLLEFPRRKDAAN